MPTETQPAAAEAPIHGERLFDSFYDGLKMVAAEESKFAAMILGIDPAKLHDVGSNFSLDELKGYTDNLRDLYYGTDEKPALHNALINKALQAHISKILKNTPPSITRN